MKQARWRRSKTCVFNVAYHLIWCPKYRRKVLTDGVDIRLKELFLEKAQQIGAEIASMEIMPDHVHLFVRANPVLAPHYIVQQLKGYSSRVIRSEFDSVRKRIPTLWTRSYYCESIGHISEDVIKKYISEQKSK